MSALKERVLSGYLTYITVRPCLLYIKPGNNPTRVDSTVLITTKYLMDTSCNVYAGRICVLAGSDVMTQ